MDTDQTTICTSQNVHIGQEVVIVDRIQLGHCISYADGTVTAIDPSQMIEVRFTNTYSASQKIAMSVRMLGPYRCSRNCGMV